MKDADRDVLDKFHACVNMTPKQLEDWLDSDESKQVGAKGSDDAESVGHASGRRIVGLLRTRQADYTASDLEHMRKVVGYIHRHLAQRPEGDVRQTRWRYSLMNWGHDPTA